MMSFTNIGTSDAQRDAEIQYHDKYKMSVNECERKPHYKICGQVWRH
jgi:hypothetical protein